MIWTAVVPTLVVLQLLFGSLIDHFPMVVRTVILVTIAVPIVVYVLLPKLQALRKWLIHARGWSR
jgi:antibiotic biosynthesis monooxygenase (ABM) superfamily enzyme